MSKLTNSRPVIVGIFILIGIAILVVTIFTLGGQKKTFVKSFTIYAIFNDVGGLIKGGNVWFSGVKVGTIKSITFSENAQVKVTMSIENSVQSHIHKNAFAKIGSDGLIGNKIVVIYGGDVTMPPIEKNDFLVVEKLLSTDDMLATLQLNNKNLLTITSDFKNISKKIDSGNGTLATLLNDPTIVNKLNNSIDNLQATATNFKTVSLTSKNVLENLQNFTNKINKHGTSINDLVTDTIMYKNIRGSLSKIETAANELSTFSMQLKTVGEKLHQKNNIVGVLLNDSISAASLKITMQNVETSSQKLEENLEALQHNFLLRRYFRKKEKAKAKL
jgi:phospholipid/cholesterol/gamma-HCH transport system substrate-binding protein